MYKEANKNWLMIEQESLNRVMNGAPNEFDLSMMSLRDATINSQSLKVYIGAS